MTENAKPRKSWLFRRRTQEIIDYFYPGPRFAAFSRHDIYALCGTLLH